jgi:hypothetical protein
MGGFARGRSNSACPASAEPPPSKSQPDRPDCQNSDKHRPSPAPPRFCQPDAVQREKPVGDSPRNEILTIDHTSAEVWVNNRVYRKMVQTILRQYRKKCIYIYCPQAGRRCGSTCRKQLVGEARSPRRRLRAGGRSGPKLQAQSRRLRGNRGGFAAKIGRQGPGGPYPRVSKGADAPRRGSAGGDMLFACPVCNLDGAWKLLRGL